jgi:DNA-binding transcriptional LysR family regulator
MHLRQVDLNLLVSLDELLTERNVTRAAEKLSISQSALSTQLSRLRELFADPLLIPQARGMIPTQRALTLITPLKQFLTQAQALVSEQSHFDPATSTATVRIATTGALHFVLCVPLIKLLREQAPNLRLALYQLDTKAIARQLEQGEVDLVLTTPQLLNPQWRARHLLHEEFVTVLRTHHPAIDRAHELETFCGLDHLLVSPSAGSFRGVVDDILASIGRSRRVVLSVQNFLVVPYILEATDVIATLPTRLSRSFPNSLRVIKPPIAIGGFEVHSAWHPRSHNDLAHQWIRQQLERVAEQLSAGNLKASMAS